MSILIGTGGAKSVKEIYVGVDGKPRKVKEGYVGVDGVPKRFYQAAPTGVFGVMWDSASRSTGLTRLTASNDPLKLVTVDIRKDPVPAVGASDGSSPFDAYMPWAGMEEYNITGSGTAIKSGSPGFSRSGDTMVYIPEFGYKVYKTGTKTYFYVSSTPTPECVKHPGSGKYVGKYITGTGYVSKTGVAPQVEMTRAEARDASARKGRGWQQWGFDAWSAVWLLFLVEFADWDSQEKVGYGYVDSYMSIDSGLTDTMKYHTGTTGTSVEDSAAVQYRHLENLWGNVYQRVDGVNFNEGEMLVCLDPAKYADDTTANYTSVGTKVQEDGFIKGIGYSPSMPWAFFPTDINGDEGAYIPDMGFYNDGWCILSVGGTWDSGTSAGLWHFVATEFSGDSGENFGSRLVYVP